MNNATRATKALGDDSKDKFHYDPLSINCSHNAACYFYALSPKRLPRQQFAVSLTATCIFTAATALAAAMIHAPPQ